jgi:hypothetical protein
MPAIAHGCMSPSQRLLFPIYSLLLFVAEVSHPKFLTALERQKKKEGEQTVGPAPLPCFFLRFGFSNDRAFSH